MTKDRNLYIALTVTWDNEGVCSAGNAFIDDERGSPCDVPGSFRLEEETIKELADMTADSVRSCILKHFEPRDPRQNHERRITRCRSCNAKIIWFETPNGKRMPVDADTVEPDDDELDLGRHQSHFVSCPNADHHRKRR